MKALFRDHLMIVVSIALPVAVVVLFAAASLLPRLYTEPPVHNLVLALDSQGIHDLRIPVRIDLTVAGGRLHAEVYQLESDGRGVDRGFTYKPRIFEYIAATDAVREIPLELPENLTELPEGTEIPIPELADTRLVTTLRAPDGYEFDLDRSSGGGLFREIFGTGGRAWQPRISKSGVIVEIDLPLAGHYYYYRNVRFIGWVAGESG